MFKELRERIYIEYEIELLSDTMVSNGSNVLANPDNILLTRAGGSFYIPGSTMKGILRSALESAVRTVGDDNERACDPTQNNGGCGECPVCLVFGGGGGRRGKESSGYASSVVVHDADLISNPGTNIRTMVGIDRKTGAKVDGVLYTLESQRKSSLLSGSIVIDNPSTFPEGKAHEDAKLGAVLSAIKLFNLVGGIGGGTTRGWGNAVIRVNKIRKFSTQDFIKHLQNNPQGDFQDEEIFGSENRSSTEDLKSGKLEGGLSTMGVSEWWNFVGNGDE